jgi:hypothetical protein
MTTNTKIIIGVGAVALAYYFYNKSKGNDKNFSNFDTPVSCSQKFCPPQRPYKYRVNSSCYCSTTPKKRVNLENPILVNP